MPEPDALDAEDEALPVPAQEAPASAEASAPEGGPEEPEQERLPDRPVAVARTELIALAGIELDENIRAELGDISELAETMRVQGLIHPVTVRPAPDGAGHGKPYELIAGFRRRAAAESLGWKEIPAAIHDAADEDVLVERITENLQRENPSPVDEARAMQRMIDVFGWSHRQVAAKLGVDRSQVTKRLSMLRLPDPVIGLIAGGQITASHAEVIASLDTPAEQEEIAELAAKSGAPVRKVAAWTEKIKEQKEQGEQDAAAGIDVPDASTPLLVLGPQDAAPLPGLAVKEDWTPEMRDRAVLYLLLHAGNDIEMLEHLQAHYNVSASDLGRWAAGLDADQAAEQADVMLRRWYAAPHRYPALAPEIRELLGDGPAGEAPAGPLAPEGAQALRDSDDGFDEAGWDDEDWDLAGPDDDEF